MKKTILTFLIIILNLNLSFSQTKSEIDSLLNGISETENSKEITKSEQAKKIIAFGENSLTTLAEFFTDSTETKVKSECQERNLTKGEIAIIMADQIEFMPYGTLTGIQNCLLTFCKNNPNLVEYYFWAIKRDGVQNFQKKYIDWLKSDEHKKYTPLFVRKTEKEIEKQEKKKARKEKREKRRAEKNK
ncbi:hypothetical protein Fleli_2359 [Bernardetia litoralis DSM 6794]|uniref:Uncharacterized protein n=1 Tax=Bernardetia litoralis (strain ATCC 23117 / DSM 6794 / NBRC 15988 / NCIMB 1366 / Fx l1 / Sio-4) TaxID=880071 RepID=I4AL96_BERLS|nr:hypothetical protein [Bernardetia litoralis]AFM04731.1 hypothetical protein Fleli_2359 [Bernardetia litoralis DSM 6794]